MQIRKATKNDLKILTDFWFNEEKFSNKFDKKAELRKDSKKRIYNFLKLNINKKNYTAFIAEEKNQPIGVIQANIKEGYFLYKTEKVGHVGTAYIKKEYRNKGVIRALYKELIKWFKFKKISWIDLYVHKKNKKAYKVYEKLGFKEILKIMRTEI